MTRQELGESLNLKIELIPEDMQNRPGTSISATSITIHNTSNANSGADADAHSRFVRTKGYYENEHTGKRTWVSWHYTVDDKKAIKQLPINEKAFHAKEGNETSIGIETCMHKEIDQEEADDRLARLVAVLCYDLKFSTDAVFPHKKWTGKNCPILLLKKWEQFIERINHYLDAITESKKVKSRSLSISKNTFNETMCWEGVSD